MIAPKNLEEAKKLLDEVSSHDEMHPFDEEVHSIENHPKDCTPCNCLNLIASTFQQKDDLAGKLVEGLEFYANESNYHPNGTPMTPYVNGKPDYSKPNKDRGLVARQALSTYRKEIK